MIDLYNGDCLEIMKSIPSQSVDMVLTDPPYGTTACKWDSVIPFEPMWEELKRIIKPNGAIVLFGSQPFTTAINYSNLKDYRYEWVWVKGNTTGFQNANKRPMKKHELISVFYSKQPTYNPQGIQQYNKKNRRGHVGDNYHEMKSNCYTQKYTNYPTQLLEFNYDTSKLHPTQKPVALLEYLIKTYTQEGETVLDFTMGSGSAMIACLNTNRKGIGIELDKHYFDVAKKRIADHQATLESGFFIA